MDPNANLKEQLDLVRAINQIRDNCGADGSYTDAQLTALAGYAERLAELVEAMDGWIRKGGFLPKEWTRNE